MDKTQLPNQLKTIFQTELFTYQETHVTVGRLLTALLVLGGVFILSKMAQRAIKLALNRKQVQNEQTIAMSCALIRWLILIVGVVISLQIVGIDLSTLFAAGAVFTVGLGFAMQNIAQNFVSGIILFVERTIKPGDILLVNNQIVKIEKIGIRSTVARTREEDQLIIPNSSLVQGTVTNYTMTDANHLLSTSVGVSYDSDMKIVKKVLLQVANKQPWRLVNGRASVLMKEFGNSAVNFSIYVEVFDPWNARTLKAQLNEAVWWALQEADITIAYPQLDVHFKNSLPH